MSKEKLFEYYLLKNPALLDQIVDGRVVMSSRGFKKFFETTYDVAYKQGFNQESDSDKFEPEPVSNSDSKNLKDILNLFGMR
jgi:hypothetical protein